MQEKIKPFFGIDLLKFILYSLSQTLSYKNSRVCAYEKVLFFFFLEYETENDKNQYIDYNGISIWELHQLSYFGVYDLIFNVSSKI